MFALCCLVASGLPGTSALALLLWEGRRWLERLTELFSGLGVFSAQMHMEEPRDTNPLKRAHKSKFRLQTDAL